MEKEKASARVQVTMRLSEANHERLKEESERTGSSYNSLANIALDVGLRALASDVSFQFRER